MVQLSITLYCAASCSVWCATGSTKGNLLGRPARCGPPRVATAYALLAIENVPSPVAIWILATSGTEQE